MKCWQMFTIDLNSGRHMRVFRDNKTIVAWKMKQVVGHSLIISSTVFTFPQITHTQYIILDSHLYPSPNT